MWALIFALSTGASGITTETVDFQSKEDCMQAAAMVSAQAKNTLSISNPILICVPKGYKR